MLKTALCVARSSVFCATNHLEVGIRQMHLTSQLGWDGFLMHRLHSPRKYKSQVQDRKPIKDANIIKGIVLKTMIMRPRKPNSGNRQCCLVRLSNGKECNAYIPGEGHNLQEHSQVFLRGGRRKDLIAVRAIVMRGMLDCAPVKKKIQKTAAN